MTRTIVATPEEDPGEKKRPPVKRKPWAIPAVAVEQMQTCFRAADMSAKGASWPAIAKELGLESALAARKCAERGYGLAPGEDYQMARRKAATELDMLRRESWKIIDDPGPMTTVSGALILDPETREPMEDRQAKIAAINSLRAINAEYRKLYGTDAPKLTASVSASAPLEDLQAAVIRMRAEVAAAEAEAADDPAPDDDDDDGPLALPAGTG